MKEEMIKKLIMYLSLALVGCIIIWWNTKPIKQIPLDKQLESIQEFYDIQDEARVTVDHVFENDDREDVFAYYKMGNVYLCNRKLDECTYEQKLFALAHELAHHKQKLKYGDEFRMWYTQDPENAEHEANIWAAKYMHDVWKIDFEVE